MVLTRRCSHRQLTFNGGIYLNQQEKLESAIFFTKLKQQQNENNAMKTIGMGQRSW